MNIPEVPDLPYNAYLAYMTFDEGIFKNAFILSILVTEVMEENGKKIFKGKFNGELIEGDYHDLYLTESGARQHLVSACHELLNETKEKLDKIYEIKENLIASIHHSETKLKEIWADESPETIE